MSSMLFPRAVPPPLPYRSSRQLFPPLPSLPRSLSASPAFVPFAYVPLTAVPQSAVAPVEAAQPPLLPSFGASTPLTRVLEWAYEESAGDFLPRWDADATRSREAHAAAQLRLRAQQQQARLLQAGAKVKPSFTFIDQYPPFAPIAGGSGRPLTWLRGSPTSGSTVHSRSSTESLSAASVFSPSPVSDASTLSLADEFDFELDGDVMSAASVTSQSPADGAPGLLPGAREMLGRDRLHFIGREAGEDDDVGKGDWIGARVMQRLGLGLDSVKEALEEQKDDQRSASDRDSVASSDSDDDAHSGHEDIDDDLEEEADEDEDDDEEDGDEDEDGGSRQPGAVTSRVKAELRGTPGEAEDEEPGCAVSDRRPAAPIMARRAVSRRASPAKVKRPRHKRRAPSSPKRKLPAKKRSRLTAFAASSDEDSAASQSDSEQPGHIALAEDKAKGRVSAKGRRTSSKRRASSSSSRCPSSIRRVGHRSKLSPASVAVLRDYFVENVRHPFPDDSDKAWLVHETGLSLKQVCDWFTNNRKRYWRLFESRMLGLGCALVEQHQPGQRGGDSKHYSKHTRRTNHTAGECTCGKHHEAVHEWKQMWEKQMWD